MSTRGSTIGIRALAPPLIGYGVPFGLVLYLALRGGGYDVLVRDEVAIAVWSVLAIGAIAGLPLLGRLERRAWVALGLLAALTLWTGLGALWSESAERSIDELGRVGTYLGVFVLALSLQSREDALKRTLFGVAGALGLVGALAVLSRLHPQWFPDNASAAAGNSEGLRLNYPLNYWNGLGNLVAMGIPLLLMAAGSARSLVARCLFTLALPIAVLAIFLTFSRGAWLTALLALAVFLIVHPRRLATLPLLLISGAGGGALVFAASRRDELENGLATQLARDQGNEMIVITLVACAVVVALALWLDRAQRGGFDPLPPDLPRRTWAAVTTGGVLVALVAALALGIPGEVSDAWDQFKQPDSAGTGSERLTSAASNGRFEYWGAALDAGVSKPITGIGPGAWDLWWSREATIPGFTRDAHSLYLESFAELGIVGLLLVLGLIGSILAAAASRARWAPDEERGLLAGGIGCAVAFVVAMGLDWGWEIAVMPCAFLLVAAALLGPDSADPPNEPGEGRRRSPLAIWAAVAATGVAMLVAVVPAMLGEHAVRDSQSEVAADDLPAALDRAERAESLRPYAATPLIQQALVLQLQGQLDPAATLAQEATATEPTNWRPWFTLARIEKERGDLPAAEAAYAQALDLNPRSTSVLTADPSP